MSFEEWQLKIECEFEICELCNLLTSLFNTCPDKITQLCKAVSFTKQSPANLQVITKNIFLVEDDEDDQ